MSETTGDWLRRIGLEHFVEAFARQKISIDLLEDLTETDLADLGLTIGDRKVFLRALRGRNSNIQPAPVEAETRDSAAWAPERRFLTIAFVDLVGSTAMSTQIDAEELHEVLRTYLGTVREITKAYGGYVLKYLGDGVLSVFGWPIAHEDQGERAALMALEVLRKVQAMTPRPDVNLKLRAGIASGALVVGDIAGDVNDVTGPAANMAQRLQSKAQPGEILIDETTRATLPRGFELTALGPVELKGFSEPVNAFRLESADANLRQQSAPLQFGQPIFGRDTELEVLDELWLAAQRGRGGTVVVQGEPGIGKTRLVSEFFRLQPKASHIVLPLQCFEYRSVSALYPLLQTLMRSAGFRRDDDNASRKAKLSTFLTDRCEEAELALSLFATLLSIADETDEAYLDKNVPDRVLLALEIFVEMTLNGAKEVPVIVYLEDAHWADPSTISYCSILSELVADRDILLVIATRPEWVPPEDAFSGAHYIHLEKLKRDDSRRIIELAVGEELSPTTYETILQRGQDIPLYLEELARVAVENPRSKDLPLSIRSSMLARIDRLGEDRPIIQLLAVLGPTFSLESLLEISNYDRPLLEASLARLVDARMLVRSDTANPNRYQFRHTLIQEAAYTSVLRRTRSKLHNQVAEALLRRLQKNRFADPEVLARHLSLASRSAEAIPYWQAAGDRLARQSAHTEAAQQYEKGLADVDSLPAGTPRDEKEYQLRVRLSAALLTVEGWSAQRVAQNYESALILSNRLNDPQKQFLAMRGRFNVLLLRGELSAARALVAELNQIARKVNDKVLIAEALKIDGGCAVHEADFVYAAKRLEESIEIFKKSSDSERAVVFGTDLVVISLVHLAWAKRFLGEPELADQHMSDALKVARSGQHVFSEAYAEAFASSLCQFKADAGGAMGHAETTISISEKYQFHYFEGWGRILRGWSMTFLGDPETGLEEIDLGISIYRRTGAELIMPYANALREEAQQVSIIGGLSNLPANDQNTEMKSSSESRFYCKPN